MSTMTNTSEDEMPSKGQGGSLLTDEVNCGGSVSGGVALKKGPWTSAEDAILVEYVKKHGEGNWNAVQKNSGLLRCGKSCRLRWANHLRPNLKKGAFTQEEERLIIELHAKMGNKWARMAAHLPGRTDNEIKNYWNTRIKRRQRAGLPLYPPEVCLQAYQEKQQNNNASGDTEQLDLLETNSYEIPDVIFESLKTNHDVLPYVPEIPNIPTSTMLMKGFGSSQYYGYLPPMVHSSKRPRESTSSFSGYDSCVRNETSQFDQTSVSSCDNVTQSFSLPIPYDPDPITNNAFNFGGNQGGHSLLNGNFSASKPLAGSVKLELPSLQYTKTDFSSWGSSSPPAFLESVDAFIQSPPQSGALQSDCLSPQNSGLLDALLQEAKSLSTKNQFSDKSSNSSTITPVDMRNGSALDIYETKWEEYGDSSSPLGEAVPSLFSECTPVSGSSGLLDEKISSETFPGSDVKSESVEQNWILDGVKKDGNQLDFSRPDALLGTCWIGPSVACSKGQDMMTDAITTALGDDLGHDYKQMSPGTPLNQGWGLSSCAWNNMPAVCQMTDLP
ncbi:hypothetical protein NMG60_11029655 [Bertholletia excelsa]